MARYENILQGANKNCMALVAMWAEVEKLDNWLGRIGGNCCRCLVKWD